MEGDISWRRGREAGRRGAGEGGGRPARVRRASGGASWRRRRGWRGHGVRDRSGQQSGCWMRRRDGFWRVDVELAGEEEGSWLRGKEGEGPSDTRRGQRAAGRRRRRSPQAGEATHPRKDGSLELLGLANLTDVILASQVVSVSRSSLPSSSARLLAACCLAIERLAFQAGRREKGAEVGRRERRLAGPATPASRLSRPPSLPATLPPSQAATDRK